MEQRGAQAAATPGDEGAAGGSRGAQTVAIFTEEEGSLGIDFKPSADMTGMLIHNLKVRPPCPPTPPCLALATPLWRYEKDRRHLC